ncbi:MAG: glutamine amidotransferase [Jatrophihabitans sp.]|uniref:glutamine amidotransferase n=1 Tax=Jatrophihabitans sp. TaxID=1932789 RepID=UPI003F7DE772
MTAPFLMLSIRPEDAAAEDEYAAMLRCTGLTPGGMPMLRLDRTDLGDLDVTAWSGIVLGGGPWNAGDPERTKTPEQRRAETALFRLLDEVQAHGVPFLGCCYGIGVVGRWLGATVDHTFGEPVGAVPVTRSVAGRTDALFAGLPDTFDAFVGHKEAINGALPGEAVVLASSPMCPVQAFRVGAHIHATQFHPELDVDGLCRRVDVYRHHGYFPPDRADEVKAAARRSTVVHPPTVLRTFVELAQRSALSA